MADDCTLGTGDFTYRVEPNWHTMPPGYEWREVAAVAVDGAQEPDVADATASRQFPRCAGAADGINGHVSQRAGTEGSDGADGGHDCDDR